MIPGVCSDPSKACSIKKKRIHEWLNKLVSIDLEFVHNVEAAETYGGANNGELLEAHFGEEPLRNPLDMAIPASSSRLLTRERLSVSTNTISIFTTSEIQIFPEQEAERACRSVRR